MCENPFFELVGAKGYSDSDRSKRVENKFDEFKNKHGKQYKDEIEEALRKTHFRHNYRWAYVTVSSSLGCFLCGTLPRVHN